MSQPLVDLAELKADHFLEDWRDRMQNPMSGFSSHTVRNYELGLSRFVTVALPDPEARDLHELSKVLQATRPLRKAVEALSERYAKSTVEVTMAAVKHLVEFGVEIGKLAAPPVWPKVRMPVPEFDPPHYSDDEAAALVAAASTDPASVPIGPRIRVPMRDRALLRVLFATGMRAAEVVNFDVGWLRGSGDERVLSIVGKGSKLRHLPIGAAPELSAVFDEYLDWRRGTATIGDEVVSPSLAMNSPMFTTSKGGRFTYDQLRGLFDSWLAVSDHLYASKASRVVVPQFSGTAKLHACRHTAAFSMVSSGLPLNQVQAWLGHSSISVTSAYLRATGAELAQAANKALVVP